MLLDMLEPQWLKCAQNVKKQSVFNPKTLRVIQQRILLMVIKVLKKSQPDVKSKLKLIYIAKYTINDHVQEFYYH